MYFYGMEHTETQTITISKFIIKNHKDNGHRFFPSSGRYSRVFNILNEGNLGFTEGYYEHDDSPGMIGNDYHLWIAESSISEAVHWEKLDKMKGLVFVEEIEVVEEI